jgi:hypothetical protein
MQTAEAKFNFISPHLLAKLRKPTDKSQSVISASNSSFELSNSSSAKLEHYSYTSPVGSSVVNEIRVITTLILSSFATEVPWIRSLGCNTVSPFSAS